MTMLMCDDDVKGGYKKTERKRLPRDRQSQESYQEMGSSKI